MTVPVDTLTPGSRLLVVTESLLAAPAYRIETVQSADGGQVATDEHLWQVYEEDGRLVIGSRHAGEDPFSFTFSTAFPLPAGGGVGHDRSGRHSPSGDTGPDSRPEAARAAARRAADHPEDPDAVRAAVDVLTALLPHLERCGAAGDARSGGRGRRPHG